MRHQYTPIFRDVLTSRLWAMPHATVRVWLWLKVSADPEGFICSSLAGVAVGARVSLTEAREAMDELVRVDPDADPCDPLEGRLIERCPRGWQVLGVEDERDLAKAEAEKARKRRQMRRFRAERASHDSATRDTLLPPVAPEDLPVAANDGEVDQPKPTPKPKPSLQEERSPLPPAAFCNHKFVDSNTCGKCGAHIDELRRADAPERVFSRYEGDRFDAAFAAPTLPTVIRSLPDDWRMSDELRAEAVTAGVPPAAIDDRIADLRTGTIGGARGVLAHKLDSYIRNQFGKWKTWAETDRARAASQKARPGALKGYGVSGAPLTLEPTERHKAFAERFGIDLGAIVADLNERGTVETLGLGRAKEILEKALAKAARAKREGAAA